MKSRWWIACEQQGFTTFLPLVKETRRWSDRKKVVEFPLFGCYVFVQLVPTNQMRLRVCQTDGVLQIVGVKGQGIAIPDDEIERRASSIKWKPALVQSSVLKDRPEGASLWWSTRRCRRSSGLAQR